MEEEVRSEPVYGDIADLVDSQQLRLAVELELVVKQAFRMSPVQGRDQTLRCHEECAVSAADRVDFASPEARWVIPTTEDRGR